MLPSGAPLGPSAAPRRLLAGACGEPTHPTLSRPSTRLTPGHRVGHSPTVSCRGPRTWPVTGLAVGHLHCQSLQWGTAVWGGRLHVSPESSSVSQHTAGLPACAGPAGGEHRHNGGVQTSSPPAAWLFN